MDFLIEPQSIHHTEYLYSAFLLTIRVMFNCLYRAYNPTLIAQNDAIRRIRLSLSERYLFIRLI